MHQNHSVIRITSMIKDYNQTLPGLEQDIVSKVRKLQKRKIFIKQAGFGFISLGSFAGVIAAVSYIWTALSNSSVFEYFSLLFSGVEILAYWKELSLSITESLPVFGLAMLFGVIGLFLWSAMRTAQLQLFKKALI